MAQRWQLATELFAAEKTPGQGAYHALLSHLAWRMFVIVAGLCIFGVQKSGISFHIGSQLCDIRESDLPGVAPSQVPSKLPLLGGERCPFSMHLVLEGLLLATVSEEEIPPMCWIQLKKSDSIKLLTFMANQCER